MLKLELDYAIKTEPYALEIESDAEITIIVSSSNKKENKKENKKITSFTFDFGNGNEAKDLISGTYIHAIPPSKEWDLEPDGSSFTLYPPNDSIKVDSNGIVFKFTDIQVNSFIGSAVLHITERYETGEKKEGNLYIPKFPKKFSLDKFYSSKPIVYEEQSITLLWEGLNLDLANYTLEYIKDGEYISIDIPKPTNKNIMSYTIDSINHNTEFYLIVSSNYSGNHFVHKIETSFVTVTHLYRDFIADKYSDVNKGYIYAQCKLPSTAKLVDIISPQLGPVTNTGVIVNNIRCYSFKTPKTTGTFDYIFKFVDSKSNTISTKEISVDVIDSYERPIYTYHMNDFLQYPQAQEVEESTKYYQTRENKILTSDMLLFIGNTLKFFKKLYPHIGFYFNWENNEVNAYSNNNTSSSDHKTYIIINGGLVRVPSLYMDGIYFIIIRTIVKATATYTMSDYEADYEGAKMFQNMGISTLDSSLQLQQIKDLFSLVKTREINNVNLDCRLKYIEHGLKGYSSPSCE
jgi:hypothetical protein